MGLLHGFPDAFDPAVPRFPLLVSYAYLRKCDEVDRDYILRRATGDGFEVLLDCGAYSAKNSGHIITLKEYVDFLHRNPDSFFRYIALDVLEDPVATDRNLKAMLSEGLSPSPVHIVGDGAAEMDRLFELSDLVFCALNRPGRGVTSKSYVTQKMRWAKGRHVHWLGYVRSSMVRALTPFSCDSSSWGSAQRFGVADVYLGRGHWMRVQRKERHRKLPLAAQAVIQSLGYTSKDWVKDDMWRMSKTSPFMSMDVTTGSWVRYIMDMRMRYGSRIFMATALAQNELPTIRRYWKQWLSEYRKRGSK